MEKILVSVIIATYNREDLIVRALKSVLGQTFLDYEIIVVDDGSIDGTKVKVLNFVSDKVKYFYQKNTGPDTARDFGISNAKGEYIAILDSDDYWADDDKLRKQVEFLDENEDYVLVGGNIIAVDELGKKINRKDNILLMDHKIRQKILIENPIAHSTVMYRKSAWSKVGGYGKNSCGFSEDWNLWLKMGKIGKLSNLNEDFTYLQVAKGYSFFWKKRSVWLDLKLRVDHRKKYPNFAKGYTLGLLYYLSFFIPFRKYMRFCFYKICKVNL